MEALMNPGMSGVHARNFRAVTDRLQALIAPGSDRTVAAPEASAPERPSARPARIPLNQAWIPRIVTRTAAPAQAMPWWTTMVLLPSVATVVAMLTLG